MLSRMMTSELVHFCIIELSSKKDMIDQFNLYLTLSDLIGQFFAACYVIFRQFWPFHQVNLFFIFKSPVCGQKQFYVGI